MKVKNLIITVTGLITTISLASDFVVVLDPKTNDYSSVEMTLETLPTEWVEVDPPYDCYDPSPLASEIHEGTSFTQTKKCFQNIERYQVTYRVNTETGEKTEISREKEEDKLTDKSVDFSDIGTYVAKSCRDIINHGGSTTNGTYQIHPDNMLSSIDGKISVYCDMTNGGYTMYTVSGQSQSHSTTAEAYCGHRGLQLFVPRTKNHFLDALSVRASQYFTIMGIYPNVKGATCTSVGFNSLTCSNWDPKDKGKWYVSEITTILEPNGDNDVNGSMLYIYTNGIVSHYNDILNSNTSYFSGGGYSADKWVCSAKDENEF